MAHEVLGSRGHLSQQTCIGNSYPARGCRDAVRHPLRKHSSLTGETCFPGPGRLQEVVPTQQSLLAALMDVSGVVAPLQALRLTCMSGGVYMLPSFASTLVHLVLPDVSWETALRLPAAVSQLTLLEVRRLHNLALTAITMDRTNYGSCCNEMFPLR